VTLQFRAGDIIANTDDECGSPEGPAPASGKYSPRTSALVILGLSALLWSIIIVVVKALLAWAS
jgi:hypothetical protein